MVLPNGKGHVCFTYWSNSPEVPIDKPSLPEKAESYWIFNDMFPGLLMGNYQFLSGKVLLSSKLWVFAFWHQSKNVSKSTNRSQSLRHLAWNKILDDSLTYLRYNLCFVNFFNSPSSNEKKKMSYASSDGLWIHNCWTPIIICLKMKIHLYHSNNEQ